MGDLGQFTLEQTDGFFSPRKVKPTKASPFPVHELGMAQERKQVLAEERRGEPKLATAATTDATVLRMRNDISSR